jgi:hypothetical protein
VDIFNTLLFFKAVSSSEKRRIYLETGCQPALHRRQFAARSAIGSPSKKPAGISRTADETRIPHPQSKFTATMQEQG